MPTIRDVAKEAGVSIATVSRVINRIGHPVSESTRARVLAAVQALDFHPSAVAKSLSKRTAETIGVVIPDISNPYYAEIVRGIQDGAEAAGYTAILRNTDRSQRKVVEAVGLFREKMADGIILVGGELPDADLQAALGKMPIPGIVVGRQHIDLPSVQIDNVAAAADAVRHLASLGRTRIAFLSGPKGSHTMEDRFSGFLRGLELNEREYDDRFVSWGAPTVDDGFQRAETMLSDVKNRPDALFAANDQLAMGAIRAVEVSGIHVPKDVAVVGFDNTRLAAYYSPSLTTIDVPRYQIGELAIRLLLDSMAGREVPRISWLATRLVVRGSTGAR